MADLNIKLHKGIIIAVMNYLPINKAGIDLTGMSNKIWHRLTATVSQIKLATAQSNSCVDNFFTRPGHQVKQDEFVGVALRHVVCYFAHIEPN
ncbi:hypothetical protein HmCmsJML188_02838 [Escherichia coli]|nr:hypothetical protein HmCmsJML188_02838 [Escherichia coli]